MTETTSHKIKKEPISPLLFMLGWIKDAIEPWTPTKIKQSVYGVVEYFAKYFSPVVSIISNTPLSIQDDQSFILTNSSTRETTNSQFSLSSYELWGNMREIIFYVSENSVVLFLLIAAAQIKIASARGELISIPTSTPIFATVPASAIAPSTPNPLI
jgi:hypothetical protein